VINVKNNLFHVVLVVAAFGLTAMAILGGAYFRSGLDVTEGMYSEERIRAPHVMENMAETERNRVAAYEFAQRLETIYAIDPYEWQFVDNNLLLLRGDIELIREAYSNEMAAYLQAHEEWEEGVAQLNSAAIAARMEWDLARAAALAGDEDLVNFPPQPEIPIPPPEPEFLGEALEQFATLHMLFTETAQQMLVTMEDDGFNMMWAAVFTVAETVQLNHDIDEIDFVTARQVHQVLGTLTGLDRVTEELVENIVLNHLRPNVIPNVEENLRRFNETRNNYERAFFYEGDIIVDEGELVTSEIYQLLAQLGLLRSDSLRDNMIPLLGVLGLVVALFTISLMYMSFYHPSITTTKKEAALLFTIFVLSLGLTWTFREFSFPFVPLLIFPMLVSLLLDRRCGMVLTFSMVFICFFVVEGSLSYLLFYATSGALICLLSRFTTERNKIFIVGLLVTAIQFILSISIAFIIERAHAFYDLQGMLVVASFAAASGMLTVIICTGSLPFWETFFGVVTPVKLLDLTNPTNILLRRLTIEAPGTYHHSLIVANLAETAAYDIGANSHAARVGGYYHDVGKLKFPHYFAENIDGENPHDHLDTINSAQLIISHVSYGLTLASEHRLPQFVRDMIKEHHGTTLLQYFYAKAKESDPSAEDKDYRYPFVIPQTRESACVMLADSVEAAVRATIPKLNSVDEVAATIRNIVRSKLNDGQLAESQLSIKDVTIIEQSFFRVLKGMYHERIAYPKSIPVRMVGAEAEDV